MYQSHRFKIDKSWSLMMKPNSKTWHTLNEDTLQKAAAAWKWLHTYLDGRRAGGMLEQQIGDALMTKWAPIATVLQRGDEISLRLGNRVWAGLTLPLQRVAVESDPDVVYYTLFRAPIQWLHILSPIDWWVLPFEACRVEGKGIIFRVTQAPIPLVKHVLSSKNKNLLNDKDITRMALRLGLGDFRWS